MTTMTMSNSFSSNRDESRSKGPMIFVVLILLAILATYMYVANDHAVNGHGQDAADTAACHNKNGTWKAFRVGNTEFHLLCLDDNGMIRDMILERQSNTSSNFYNKNMFTPKDGSWTEVNKWLMRKNAQQVQLPSPMNIIP